MTALSKPVLFAFLGYQPALTALMCGKHQSTDGSDKVRLVIATGCRIHSKPHLLPAEPCCGTPRSRQGPQQAVNTCWTYLTI